MALSSVSAEYREWLRHPGKYNGQTAAAELILQDFCTMLNTSAAPSPTSATPSTSTPSTAASSSIDQLYSFDTEAVAAMRKKHPWTTNHHYFTECKVSTLAVMKMLKHAMLGVERGRAANGVPQEIMGLMIGKPEGNSIVILDVAPLPVTGTETRVVADDASAYMIQLLESLELRRKDAFIGWYHSHPFDVESYSHCHLSNTDVLTQTNWQQSLGMWTAIVIDPLRSLALQQPELGAYRVYPQRHTPAANECPDGTIMTNEHLRAQRWGHSHNRYYELKISYFTSSLGSSVLNSMSGSSMWAAVLSSTPQLAAAAQQKLTQKIQKINQKLSTSEASIALNIGTTRSNLTGVDEDGRKEEKEFHKAATEAKELAEQSVNFCCSQQAKHLLFSLLAAQEHVELKKQAQKAQLKHSDSMQLT